jgi:hypothetical protein
VRAAREYRRGFGDGQRVRCTRPLLGDSDHWLSRIEGMGTGERGMLSQGLACRTRREPILEPEDPIAGIPAQALLCPAKRV